MVNLNELRKKYDAIQKAQAGGGGNEDFLKKFFMMEEGTSVIRVLPPTEGSEDEFYAETAIHRINDKNYHCPRVKGHDCPVCDLYYRLWKVKGPMEDEAQAMARTIKPRKRYYMNVVDRRDGTVKILSMGMKLFGKILDCFFDEDFGDITNLGEGWDFKVVKDTQGQWPNYDKSGPKPKTSAAGTKKEQAVWMDELHDIHGLVKLPEYDELKQMANEIESLVLDRPSERVVPPTSKGSSETGDEGGDEDYIAHLKSLKAD
tara:strand:+ start:611 stop:1390 length:780 start_codon:yes stop_codon:yes gene_type:complete